jgi:hypothetical protein
MLLSFHFFSISLNIFINFLKFFNKLAGKKPKDLNESAANCIKPLPIVLKIIKYIYKIFLTLIKL